MVCNYVNYVDRRNADLSYFRNINLRRKNAQEIFYNPLKLRLREKVFVLRENCDIGSNEKEIINANGDR